MIEQNFLYHHILFTGSCSINQECVAKTECPFAKQVNTVINTTINEDLKKALKEAMSSMVCGKPSADTVCCDIEEGKSFLK